MPRESIRLLRSLKGTGMCDKILGISDLNIDTNFVKSNQELASVDSLRKKFVLRFLLRSEDQSHRVSTFFKLSNR